MGKVIRKINGVCTKEYRAWKAMKSRCYSKSNQNVGNYQKDNIIVCQRWIHSFENFLEDMGIAPDKNFTIDRINPIGNYSPENCRWATMSTQAKNRGSFNILITHNNETKVLKDWARYYNIPYITLWNRIVKLNLSFEDAITFKRKCKKYSINNIEYTMKELCEKYNSEPIIIYSRLKDGWNLLKALQTPRLRNKNK